MDNAEHSDSIALQYLASHMYLTSGNSKPNHAHDVAERHLSQTGWIAAVLRIKEFSERVIYQGS